MDIQVKKQDHIFFAICVMLGLLFEQSFFHDIIGISYLIYIIAFYWVFFWRFRSHSFTNRRIGFLLMISVWLLAASYLLYTNQFFYMLNALVIPCLLAAHIILITGPNGMQWHRFSFVVFILRRVLQAISYNVRFFKHGKGLVKGRTDHQAYRVGMKVGIGLLLSVPLLLLIITLLSSADVQFGRLMGGIPRWLSHINAGEIIPRAIVVFIYTLCVFGLLQGIRTHEETMPAMKDAHRKRWDGIIVSTLLVMMNLIYVLFVAVQFQYFFSNTLQGDFTYAEYARRGFFELLVVTIINLSVLTGVVTFAKAERGMRRFVQLMLTLLVAASTVMLISAFLRLSLYEEMYGFTLLRVLAHSFMIFLGVLFAYTLVKVWMEQLSLRHFYFIAALVYYVSLNMIHIDGIIVHQNLERYERTGNIDVHYLNSLSHAGVDGLIDLYETNSDIPELKELLRDRKIAAQEDDLSWQSFHLLRSKVNERLRNMEE